MQRIVALASLLIGMSAQSFDWNGKTVAHILDFGKMQIESGHPLATHRSFLIATDPEEVSQDTLDAMEKVYGESLSKLRSEKSEAMQSVLFGNWLNEIVTNIDVNADDQKEGKGHLHNKALDLASILMHRKYKNYLDFVQSNPSSKGHSPRFSQSTGYSSTNYLHSMMISLQGTDIGKSQPNQSEMAELILRYSFYSLMSAMVGLAETTIAVEKGLIVNQQALLEDERYIDALTSIGSVLHIIQDSAVACTDGAKKYVPCIPGDGHSIIEKIDDAGRHKHRVVSLSDHEYYERPHDKSNYGGNTPHAALDKLYIKNAQQLQEVYGETDPAFSCAGVVGGVARAAERLAEMAKGEVVFDDRGRLSGEEKEKLFTRIFTEARKVTELYVVKRYALHEDRKDLPPLPR